MKNKRTIENRKMRSLDKEEEALWHRVKKTVTPIDDQRQNLKHWLDFEPVTKDKKAADITPVALKKMSRDMVKPSDVAGRKFIAPSYSPPMSVPAKATLSSSIDDKVAKKLLKGQVSIDARIDLHGMTQSVAHTMLKNFLYENYHSGCRIVLVITGKGRSNEGVLKQVVPQWLQEAPLSLYASAFRTSHVTHGGEGALYVRLRKR